jgi:hypothetical protein
VGSQHTDEKGGRGEGRRKEIRACQGCSRYCCEKREQEEGLAGRGQSKARGFQGRG